METLRKKISQVLNKPENSSEVVEYLKVFTRHSCPHELHGEVFGQHISCKKCGRKVSAKDLVEDKDALKKKFGIAGQNFSFVYRQGSTTGRVKMDDNTRATYHEWYKQQYMK